MLLLNIIILHFDKMHANIIMFHVEIIQLANKGEVCHHNIILLITNNVRQMC